MTPGDRLGQYEVVAPIGAGGMGEVFRARDTTLNRDVAIKVLSATFAADGDRLARFEREAQTLASLNHPHIAQIYGVLDLPPEGGNYKVTGLVMEFVEGEDLAQRIAHGPIPVDEALAIAAQVAGALAAAHDRGIVHRDLKPANVRVTPDGVVKVLDFGLAKALDAAGSDPSAISPADVANSPTLTMRATRMGMLVGTAAYMSPEQARAKPVDRRTDVWAFGIVLYEMLTGRRAFAGDDISDVLAAVLRDAVPLDTLPPATPPAIRRLLRRCLEKDRANRLDSMTAARLEIEEALASPEPIPPEGGNYKGGPVASAFRRNRVSLIFAGVALLLVAYLAAARPWKTRAPAASLLVAIDPGIDGSIVPGLVPEIAFSPDGRALAFAGRPRQGGRSRLYVRRLDQLAATLLPGTDDASHPFFSPDGQWIGFFASNRLCKVSTSGGAVMPLAEVQIPRGATWGNDDVITFAPVAVPGGVLMQVPASGGTPTPFGPLIAGHLTQRFPQALPGSRILLYTGAPTVNSFEDACLVAQEPGKPGTIVQCGGYAWRYIAAGYVTYVHNGTLFAAPFDVRTLKITGPAEPVVQQLRSAPASGGAQYAVSAAGDLAYVPSDPAAERRPVHIVDRTGRAQPLEGIPAGWQSMSLSPDGKQLAMDVLGQNAGIWVYDFARAAATRLTFGSADQRPIWTPDGRRITYAASSNSPPNLWWVAADGSGPPERLQHSDQLQAPEAWSPDGRTLLLSHGTSRKFDIWALPLEGDPPKPGATRPFIATPANEGMSAFSPDGKWVAYTSDESGMFQIYVRAANGTGARYQVSVTDGVWSDWSRTKPELLMGGFDGQISSVTYSVSGGAFRASRPEVWTSSRFEVGGTRSPYLLLPDGAHVAMTIQKAATVDKLVLVTSFVDNLQRRKR